MQPLALTESEIDDVVAFMASSTSPEYKEQADKEYARQLAISKVNRPQRDTARAFRTQAAAASGAEILTLARAHRALIAVPENIRSGGRNQHPPPARFDMSDVFLALIKAEGVIAHAQSACVGGLRGRRGLLSPPTLRMPRTRENSGATEAHMKQMDDSIAKMTDPSTQKERQEASRGIKERYEGQGHGGMRKTYGGNP